MSHLTKAQLLQMSIPLNRTFGEYLEECLGGPAAATEQVMGETQASVQVVYATRFAMRRMQSISNGQTGGSTPEGSRLEAIGSSPPPASSSALSLVCKSPRGHRTAHNISTPTPSPSKSSRALVVAGQRRKTTPTSANHSRKPTKTGRGRSRKVQVIDLTGSPIKTITATVETNTPIKKSRSAATRVVRKKSTASVIKRASPDAESSSDESHIILKKKKVLCASCSEEIVEGSVDGEEEICGMKWGYVRDDNGVHHYGEILDRPSD